MAQRAHAKRRRPVSIRLLGQRRSIAHDNVLYLALPTTALRGHAIDSVGSMCYPIPSCCTIKCGYCSSLVRCACYIQMRRSTCLADIGAWPRVPGADKPTLGPPISSRPAT